MKKTKRSYNRTNEILEDHGTWLIVDISTDRFPCATMAIDSDFWNDYSGGRVRAVGSRIHKYICAKCHIGKKQMHFHRIIVDAGDNEVDHIKHGSMTFIDNRRSNLRVVTRTQNSRNRGLFSSNKSGVTGVCWSNARGCWEAYITVNKSHKTLGYFDNIYFAIGARQQAEQEFFGEYAH